MTDLAKNASTALLGITYPMVSWKISGIKPVMHRQRFDWLRQKGFHLRRHRGKAAVKADHQPVVLMTVASANDICQLFFPQTKRLLAKNIFPGTQGRQHLPGMQMMTSRNHDRIDAGVAQNFVFISRAILESKFLGGMAAAGTSCRTNANQIDTLHALHRGKQHANRKGSGPK